MAEKEQKNPPEAPTGDYDLFRRAGVVRAKYLVDEGAYSVYEDGKFVLIDDDTFSKQFVPVSVVKAHRSELG